MEVDSRKNTSQKVPQYFDIRIKEWFEENIGKPTDLQMKVWSRIDSGSNVLIVSPTGTGKTLSAVLPPINEILKGRSSRGKTSIVYVSPMKALGADLVKTLENLSDGLGRIKGKKERKWGRGRRKKDEIVQDAKLHVGIRTGDVSQTERRHMLLDPPDIIITTPENLLLMLCSKARDTLLDTRYVIIDEVHEMVPSKRGALLSLCVEYLTRLIQDSGGAEPVRIGLSATVRPESTAARFLGGFDEEGRTREISIIKETGIKRTNISLRTLGESIKRDEDVLEKVIDDIGAQMEKEKGSMVIFHNTRRSAEKTAFKLIENGYESVMPHHGSLGMDVRKEAEERLKKGNLKAIVSSTSLELGLDIGLVDLVCQISSPKDPGRLLQRFGRSGHYLEGSSRGIIYPVDGVDLIESLAVIRAAQKGKLKKMTVPENPMDVLAQFMIGMSIQEGGTTKKDIRSIAHSTYPFRKMKVSELDSLLELLSMRMRGAGSVSPRLWYDQEKDVYLPRRNTKQAFYLNCGTIPKETTYKVLEEKNRRHIGELSRDFGETLYERDVIMVASKPYRIIGFTGTKIIVKEEMDAHATVPSWSGEINPRPLDVSLELIELLKDARSFRSRSAGGIHLKTDKRGRNLFMEMIRTMEKDHILPLDGRIPVEEVRSGRTRRSYIFHLPLGRNITEPLARSLSYGIRKKLGARTDYFAVDNGFSITAPKKLDRETLIKSLGSATFMDTIRELVLGSSLFRTRFAHCLSKSLLVLSRFRGKDTSTIYRRSRTDKLLKLVTDSWYSEGGWGSVQGPRSGLILLAEESFKEVFNDRIDLENCMDVLNRLDKGELDLDILEEQKGPSTMGSQIIGDPKGPGKLKKGETFKDIPGSEVANTVDGTPRNEGAGGNGSDNEDVHGLLPPPPSWEELEGEGLGWIDPDIMKNMELTFSKILKNRFRRLYRKGSSVRSMRKIPFTVHPVSTLLRSHDGSYRDLRSAVKGHRLVPGRLLGNDCMMDPKWKKTAELLSPRSGHASRMEKIIAKDVQFLNRSDIGERLDLKGDDLTSAISEMMDGNEISRYPEEVRSLLGGSDLYIYNGRTGMDPDGPEDQDIDALCSFLRSFGPFTIAELSSIFNWPPGQHPAALEGAYGLGKIDIRYGSQGIIESPTGEVNSDRLWVLPTDPLYRINDSIPVESNRCFVLPSSDPAVSMISPDPSWIEEERVRGSKNRKFTLVDDTGSRIGFCHILESIDTIRTIQVEIEDFERITPAAEALIEVLDRYGSLGYEIFTVEGLLGIPAGEAADMAVDVLLKNGFKRSQTPKGSILVRGCPVMFGITRPRLLKEIMARQGLLPGYNMIHPLQIIKRLGSFTDRWEILSRLGSVRYSRITSLGDEEISKMISEHWKSIMEPGVEAEDPMDLDWKEFPVNGTERLSDQKDLVKRFSLRRGKMDQSSDVWSMLDIFMKYPGPSRSSIGRMGKDHKRILEKVQRGPLSELDSFIRTHGLTSTSEELLKKGILLEDAWGAYEYPYKDGRIGNEPLPSTQGIAKGLREVYWTIMNIENLGAFTIEDLANYSPELVDRSKLRRIVNSISGERVTRVLSPELGMSVVYKVQGLDLSPESEDIVDDDDDRLIIISPRDRISRVVSPDIRVRLSRVSGFSIFRGHRAIALISIKKMTKAFKNTDFGTPIKGSSHPENYIIKKAWVDLRFKKRELLREIKKAFFTMGYQLVTDDEKTKIESLYRDIEKQDNRSE